MVVTVARRTVKVGDRLELYIDPLGDGVMRWVAYSVGQLDAKIEEKTVPVVLWDGGIAEPSQMVYFETWERFWARYDAGMLRFVRN